MFLIEHRYFKTDRNDMYDRSGPRTSTGSGSIKRSSVRVRGMSRRGGQWSAFERRAKDKTRIGGYGIRGKTNQRRKHGIFTIYKIILRIS